MAKKLKGTQKKKRKTKVKVVNLVTVEPNRHLVELEVHHPPDEPPKNWEKKAKDWLADVWKGMKR